MILPIRLFGDPILRDRAVDVEGDSPDVQQLIDDMIETMHAAPGIGLAANQVGRRERVFVVDLSRREREDDDLSEETEETTGPLVFINPEIVEESEAQSEYDEGCLSIPDLNETVVRPQAVVIRFLDRNFERREIEADGMLSRVIQHEYDHLEGKLFIDRIGPFKRRLLRKRLRDVSKGNVPADYPVSVP